MKLMPPSVVDLRSSVVSCEANTAIACCCNGIRATAAAGGGRDIALQIRHREIVDDDNIVPDKWLTRQQINRPIGLNFFCDRIGAIAIVVDDR
jgi:hypothetical protein